ncbi:putative phosphoglycolate phosphatase (putative) [Lactiplantibacillus plantarum]|nr:Phosphoglycolate phosphatase (Putative) [Lactiplantibacillus plantarum subsp. plantarum P-8]MCG0769429.1 putative phosphoglycolate phosphatase (putative) [Lactiplantibacillus plantarum]MCG0779238.1 putative phosphoglycolate phosphatase (putative) [Lactiplantibacillus plantarum]MCG0788099.1 putative phosphoglycolate phosphatase (putative) [Lactiplantibacillus plantarum]MCG0794173.1 putative phosphoglycolate phosphatase (putative) [Lactiplantibacillus plantarum]
MTYQALMFDIDGTLTNSQPAYTTVMREVLATYGKPFSPAQAQKTFPMAAEQAMTELGIAASEFDHFQAQYEDVMASHYDQIELYPGITSLFEQLPSELRLGIVTSQRRNELESGMRSYPFMMRMAVTISADDTPKRKPDPLPYSQPSKKSTLRHKTHSSSGIPSVTNKLPRPLTLILDWQSGEWTLTPTIKKWPTASKNH